MGIDAWILVEFFNEDTNKWVLMKWNTDTRKFEPAFVETFDFEQIPGESNKEYADRKDAWRETFPIESIQRCYKLFALLSDVCNNYDIVPLSKSKGIPLNISPETNIVLENNVCDEWDCDVTWFSIGQLEDVYQQDIIRPNGILHPQYTMRGLSKFEQLILNLQQCRNINGERTTSRIIMWFV